MLQFRKQQKRFTGLVEVMTAIGCADNKATRLLSELDTKAGLIERKRQGLGKPNLIFVKNFIVDNSEERQSYLQESRLQSHENHDSAIVETAIQDSSESRGTNTNKINSHYGGCNAAVLYVCDV